MPGKARKLTWGGALPTILDAIVDALPEGGGGNEPYIVQGASINNSDYGVAVLTVPNTEYNRAKEAFLAGRVVFVPEVEGVAYIVTGYSLAAVADDMDNTFQGLVLHSQSLAPATVIACTALVPEPVYE